MFLNKFFHVLLLGLFLTSWVWGQATDQNQDQQVEQTSEVEGEGASKSEEVTQVDKEGAVKISNILINDFENADRWFGAMSVDNGLVQVEKRKGAALEVRETKPQNSRFILGAKVSFFKRGLSEASIEPPSPIIIPGYTKKLSVWVYGRGHKHKLSAVVRDFKGRTFKFTFGELTFNGWQRLETDIPSDPSWPFFSQVDVSRKTFYQTHGITFLGFLIEFDQHQSAGRFYIYLDDFVAESNIYLYEKEIELAQTPEDERIEPIDDW